MMYFKCNMSFLSRNNSETFPCQLSYFTLFRKISATHFSSHAKSSAGYNWSTMKHKHVSLPFNSHLLSVIVSIHLTITYRFNHFSDCFIAQLNWAWQLYSGDRATKSMFDWSRSKFTSLWLINKLMPSWIWRSGIPWVLQQTCFSRQDGLQAGITLEEWQTV